MAPKRQLIVNEVIQSKNYQTKRFKNNKSDFKSSKSVIDWKEASEHIRKLPKPGDGKESIKPCYYCSQSKLFKMKELSKNHSGDHCYQRYPYRRK
jgi:hypothetical protein